MRLALTSWLCVAMVGALNAQTMQYDTIQIDTIALRNLETAEQLAAPIDTAEASLTADKTLSSVATTVQQDTVPRLSRYERRAQFNPNPIRAMWLAMVFPGGGQIYNRKYWKLPIFYGGFLGCMYALTWNGQMLRDYTQAYLDIMDDDPATKSYEKMLPMGYSIEGKESQFQKIFKNKKDYYRKYRDMSIFAFFGVYILSVVDAYVDAELSTFDISRDLSLQWGPAVIDSHDWRHGHSQKNYGLQWTLNY